MAKGKKKNKQAEKEDLGLGSLSLAEGEPSATQEPEPSTSQDTKKKEEVQSVPEKKEEVKEEEPEGLGLGLGKGKKKQRKATVETAKKDESDTKDAEKELEKVESAPEKKEEAKEEEAEGLGLGLGGGKRKPRKKKPAAAAGPAPAAPIPASTAPVASTPTFGSPPAVVKPPETVTSPIPELKMDAPPPGAGRGWGAPRSAPVQQAPPAAFVPQQAPVQTQVATPPAFVQHARPQAGRGRGQQPYDQKISVISSGQAPTYPATSRSSTAVACRFQIPAKVPGGKVPATKTRVVTNYLEMKIQPIKVNRYDVAIKPDRPKKFLPKVFAAAKAIKFPKQFIAFDQRKNCYSLTPLVKGNEERCTINVEVLDDNDAKMAFEVSLKLTGVVDLGTIINHMNNQGSSVNTPMEAIQCVDVILQQGTLENYVKAGRQFFKRPRNPIDLYDGLEMWTGLFQSAIFTSSAFINIDVAHKGFPKQQRLIDALVNDFRLDPSRALDRQRGIDAFQHFIKGLRVKANIGGAGTKQREYICNGIVEPPYKMSFQMTDHDGRPTREITVAKYFETEKKCRIKYPNLNCMWVGPKDKNIYYPMELLDVVYGQALNKQLNERQLSTMVRQAATPPSDRLEKIKEVIRDMNYSASPCFKHFKMEIDNKFLQVDAKILEAPKIDIGSGRPIDPRRGVWQANRLLRASALESWGFIVVEANPNDFNCDSMIQMLMKVGRQMGMAVNMPAFTNFNVTQQDLRNVLLTAQEKKLNFMFIIVSGRDKDAYHKVKRKAELEVGILTQCIREMTASRRMNEQTVRNILLKVNSKLMGINQALDNRSLPTCLKSGGVMVVGADVTHPSPDQMSVPSIAAVTASLDPKCFIYNIEMSVQTPKHEIIVDFENMMFDHLKVYKSHQNALPRKIFVFRDGVSEGQFAQVMNSELVAVHRAYARLDQVNKPEILFLLVQKRHHTRFFMGDKNPQNVEPGTVVDTHIVHPKELDFYLVSHQAIKGTARPTRYHAICNDGNIPSDEVEQLTYYLCHLYSRCTRSVSYPTPTYYAHLACCRAKSLTHGDRYNNVDLEKQPQRLRVLDRMLRCSRMFFV
ncbi:protein argonaute-2-like isoform X2 [Maniola jurtina]|uniref:protein argonaute-2-like isoform X2 n=1 Tax=Maniola jurtina TaxID=191418 RepID=UPI001E68B577|nr:protein argonaute-2-like isoform X2 [Maniola jurtina]XP_045768425.1 protein argonaute-2-like isoform X2 [Maniola jurtina]